MKNTDETMLMATDEADLLDKHLPIRYDTVDDEVYAAHYERRKADKLIRWGLIVANIFLVGGIVAASNKPAVNHYIEINERTGLIRQADYDDSKVHFSPENAAMYLKQWATFRYQVQKAHALDDYWKNYLYLDGALAHQMSQEDQQHDIVAKVAAGSDPETAIHLKDQVQFISFKQTQVGSRIYWGGEAVVYFTRTYSATTSLPERTEAWSVALVFYLNPEQVYEKSKAHPEYKDLNPGGLTIVQRPIENRTEIHG